MALFRKGPSPHQTALAMIGVRAGERLLLIGRPDPALAAELARITGLNGHTVVATDTSLRHAIDAAAADAGVLIEVIEITDSSIPPEAADPTYDAVVLQWDLTSLSREQRRDLAAGALAAARPGGRLLVIEGRRRARFFAGRAGKLDAEAVLSMLTDAGAAGARQLAEESGVAYYEGRKPR